MVRKKCIRIRKEGDFYRVSGTGKGCIRKFKPIKVMTKTRAKAIASARRRLIKKAKRKK
jgi:hypothetical protein